MKNILAIIMIMLTTTIFSQEVLNYGGKSLIVTDRIEVRSDCTFLTIDGDVKKTPEEYCKLYNKDTDKYFILKYIIHTENYSSMVKFLEYHDEVGNLIYLEVFKFNKPSTTIINRI